LDDPAVIADCDLNATIIDDKLESAAAELSP
jgi:hypothetical protein